MDQRKSLIVFLFIIFFSVPIYAFSAWLVEPGRYKYSFSKSAIDNNSYYAKQKRITKYRNIQKKIKYLEKKEIELKSTKEKLIKNLLRKSKIADSQTNFKIKKTRNNYDRIIIANQQKKELLKKVLLQLKSFQDHALSTISLEYGVNENTTIGIKALYKENQFINSEFTKYSSNSQSAEIYFRYKIFQNQNYILSLQPQISVIKDNDDEEIFQEALLLAGYSEKKKSVELFTQAALGLSICHSASCHNKSNYSFAVSEGIKTFKGIMVVNFTKYTLRKNYGFAYRKTLYEQLSIAKEFKLKDAPKGNFNIQLGYFLEKSLKYKLYKISGMIFSVWFEL